MLPLPSHEAGEGGFRTVLKGTLHLTGAQLFRLFSQSLFLVLVVRGLGAEAFGKVTALQALLMAVLPFSHLGTPILAVRALARDPRQRAEIWGAGLMVTLGLGSLGAILAAIFAPALLKLSFPALPLFLFAWSELALYGSVILMTGILQGEERLAAMARILAGLSLARLAVVALMTYTFGLDLAQFSLAYLLGTALCLALSLGFYARSWGRPSLPSTLADLRRVTSKGIYFSVVISGRNFLLGLDKMLLPALAGLTLAAQYGAGFRVVMFAFLPLQSFMTALYPRFFRRGGRSLDESLALWRRAAPYSLAYALPVTLLLVLLAPLARPILGPGFEAVPAIIRALAGLIILQSLYVPLGDALAGADHFPYRSFSLLLAVLCNLALNFWLIPRQGWQGAVLAAYISHVILFLFYLGGVWRYARLGRGADRA